MTTASWIFLVVFFGALGFITICIKNRKTLWELYSSQFAIKKPSHPWMVPTGIPFIENLKENFKFIEDRVYDLELDICISKALRKGDPSSGVLASWWWEATYHVGGVFSRKVVLSPGEREHYVALSSQLDRIWEGNARPEIADIDVEMQKLAIRRAGLAPADLIYKAETQRIDERIVDLRRHKGDLEHLTAIRKEHPYEASFGDKVKKRGYDLRDEIFETFERPMEKEIELRVRYNEFREKIRKHPVMSQAEKAELLRELEEHLGQSVAKKKPPISIYRKEA